MAKIMGFKMPMLIVDPSKQSPMWLSPSLVQLLEHPYIRTVRLATLWIEGYGKLSPAADTELPYANMQLRKDRPTSTLLFVLK